MPRQPRSRPHGNSSAWTARFRCSCVSYFGGIVSGNWGMSIHTHRPVLSDIMTAAPASVELVIAALLIALAARNPVWPDLRPA